MIRALDRMAEADVHRRQALITLPFLLTALHEPTRNWLLSALTHSAPHDGGVQVSKPSLQQIRNVLNMFAEADAQQGGGHGRQALAEYLRTTVLPMLRAESNEHVRRALFDLAGEQAQLLGWMSYDSGEYGLSESYLLQSLRFSEEAQNPILGAHALATMSHLATTLGHADEGVQLAKTGQAALRAASNAMFADLAVLESRSHALLGDATSAAHAVHNAERALRDVVTANEPPEMRFIDHAYIAGEIANTLVLLGDIPRAIDFAQQSIESSLSQGRARRGALSNIALARAHLARRDVDSACAAGTEALRLGQEVDSVRTTRALKSLKRRLGVHTSARPALALVEEMTEAAI
jgi:tetratricopeptide (TPR) repeat protein